MCIRVGERKRKDFQKAVWVFCVTAIAGGLAIGGGQQASSAEASPAKEASGGGPEAKRLGPPEVAPVIIGKRRFEVMPWGKERGLGQNGGYIAAFDTVSGKELWVLKVYDTAYDPALEEDVQDVFIASMTKALLSDKLHITDEKGRKYTVDPDTRSVEFDWSIRH